MKLSNNKTKLFYFILSLILTIIIVMIPAAKVSAYKNISPDEVRTELASPYACMLLIDVRTPEEYKDGHIPKSINIPLQIFQEKMFCKNIDKDTKIVVYCASGIRSKNAAQTLEELGYTNVYSLGGLIDWTYEIEK